MKFKYQNDIFEVDLRSWFYRLFSNKTQRGYPIYRSVNYNISFNSFREYWLELGKKLTEPQIILGSHSTVVNKLSNKEVAQILAAHKVPLGCCVVLYDIDPTEMIRFAEKVPEIKYNYLNDDYIIFSGKSKESVRKLVENTPTRIARVLGMDSGIIFCSNELIEE